MTDNDTLEALPDCGLQHSNLRRLNLADRLLDELQHGLNTCHLRPPAAARSYPAEDIDDEELTPPERAHVAGLMRVNNAGEVAAQGLYRGQALTARDGRIGDAMREAAAEENEHLHWCQRRLDELGARRSLLDGFWYWGSFALGALAGAAGDRVSLGFVEETERQVGRHLDKHLERLPHEDRRSRAILEAMRVDELRHAANAAQAGAAELPQPVRTAMTLVSKIMTVTAYRL